MPNDPHSNEAGAGRPAPRRRAGRPSARPARPPATEAAARPAAAGPDFAGRATADTAALVLMMAGAADGDRAIADLADRLAAGTDRRLLVNALDEAAWRIARLIDLCMTAPPAPVAR